MVPRLAPALVALLLSSCALAPGMRMNEHAAMERGRASTGNASLHVQRISTALIHRLVTEEPEREEKLRDPLEGTDVNYQYRVAPHDVLQVTVWDHPELTAPTGQFRSPEENGVQVGADGTVFFPFVGTISVVGKTVGEIRQILTEHIARVVTNPQLDVRVAAYRGKKVHVTGEVVAPSVVPLTDVPLRVQDALAAAKGFTPESDFSRVSLARDGKTYILDLQALYEQGDLSQNWLLRDGDVINVPDRSRNKVFVLGEVRAQHSMLMNRGRMSLLEALTDPVGSPSSPLVTGFDAVASNVSAIYVIRGDYNAPSVYRLDASSADALLLASQFPLRPRDVVYVETYNLARFSRVISQLLPTIQALWETYDVLNRTRILR